MAIVDEPGSQRGAVLDPTDRFSEVVFGVVMAMTFTGTISVASAGEQDIRELALRGRPLQPGVGLRRRRHVRDHQRC